MTVRLRTFPYLWFVLLIFCFAGHCYQITTAAAADSTTAAQRRLLHTLAQSADTSDSYLLDLHSHTTFSDGSDSPRALIDKALDAGIKQLAITDHDQLKYDEDAIQYAENHGLQIIRGTEISCEWSLHNPRTIEVAGKDPSKKKSKLESNVKVHLLGYFTHETPTSELQTTLADLQTKRAQRIVEILKRLKTKFNIDLTENDVIEAGSRDLAAKKAKGEKASSDDDGAPAAGGTVSIEYFGRPHIAMAIIAAGHAKSISEVFAKYLSDEKLDLPAWSLEMSEAIKAVANHGGVAVLAHPVTLGLNMEWLEKELEYLMVEQNIPLKGMEVFSSKHTKEQSTQLLEIANKLGLIPTGGSDYHGKNKDNVPLAAFGQLTDAEDSTKKWTSISRDSLTKLEKLKRPPSSSSSSKSKKKKKGKMKPSEQPGSPEQIKSILLQIAAYATLVVLLLVFGRLYEEGPPLLPPTVDEGAWAMWRYQLAKRVKENSFAKLMFDSSYAHASMTATNTATSDDSASASSTALNITNFSATSASPVTVVRTIDTNSKPTLPAHNPAQQSRKQFLFCFIGLQVSYLSWGYLQERIMTIEYTSEGGDSTGGSMDKFSHSEFLVLLNRIFGAVIAIIVALFQGLRSSSPSQSFLDHIRSIFIGVRVAPPYKYSLCSISNVLSSWFQYEALKYVSFPLQVLSKSSKILFTMLAGNLIERKSYPKKEYLMASLIAVGLVLFRIGEHITSKEIAEVESATGQVPEHTHDSSFMNAIDTSMLTEDEKAMLSNSVNPTFLHCLGLLLLLGYIFTDSFTSTWQSRIFSQHRISPLEMMIGVNFFSSFVSVIMMLLFDKFFPAVQFAISHPECLIHAALMSMFSAVGSLFIFHTIATFGAVTFASMMTARQLFSLVLSIYSFEHHVHMVGYAGLVMVFASLVLKIWDDTKKIKKKETGGGGKQSPPSSPPVEKIESSPKHLTNSSSPDEDSMSSPSVLVEMTNLLPSSNRDDEGSTRKG